MKVIETKKIELDWARIVVFTFFLCLTVVGFSGLFLEIFSPLSFYVGALSGFSFLVVVAIVDEPKFVTKSRVLLPIRELEDVTTEELSDVDRENLDDLTNFVEKEVLKDD